MQVILIAHNGLASAYQSTVKALSGNGTVLTAIDVDESSSPELVQSQLVQKLQQCGDQDTFLVLTDIYGGTPWRTAALLADTPAWNGRIAVLSGMNLAMVLEASISVEQTVSLRSLAERVIQVAYQDIQMAPGSTG